MADVHTKKQRSYNMSKIKCKDTKPEIVVRSLVHRMGYRYSLHRKDLPGKPDLVLVKHRKIIFVHGCFWHQHNCRKGHSIPVTRKKFWQTKRQGNKDRDRRNLKKLRQLGWNVLTVWECQIKDVGKLTQRIRKFLAL